MYGIRKRSAIPKLSELATKPCNISYPNFRQFRQEWNYFPAILAIVEYTFSRPPSSTNTEITGDY